MPRFSLIFALFWLYFTSFLTLFGAIGLYFGSILALIFNSFWCYRSLFWLYFGSILSHFGSILSGFSWILLYFGVFPPNLPFSHVIWRVFHYFLTLFRPFNHPFVIRCSPFAPKLDKLHGPIPEVNLRDHEVIDFRPFWHLAPRHSLSNSPSMGHFPSGPATSGGRKSLFDL